MNSIFLLIVWGMASLLPHYMLSGFGPELSQSSELAQMLQEQRAQEFTRLQKAAETQRTENQKDEAEKAEQQRKLQAEKIVENNVKKLLATNACPQCNLKGANLDGAHLEGADLNGADLTNATLQKAILTGADVNKATLTGANLIGATWTDGNICSKKSIGSCKVVPPNAHPTDFWTREYDEDAEEWYAWTEVKPPSLYVGTCWPGSLLHRSDACNDWCGRGNYINTECSENRTYCKCKESISPGTDNIFAKIAHAAQHIIDKTNDTFKDLGETIKTGFVKLGSCMEVAALSTERATKWAALQSVLSGKLTDGIIQASQEMAIQPLIGARKTAHATLDTANAFLEKVGAPIATGSIEAARQTASGALTAGEAVATGVLTGADQTIQTMLNTLDIKHLRYKGSLQEFARGNLGNVTCTAIVFGKSLDIDFDLNIKDPIASIKNLSNKIKDECIKLAKQAVDVLQQGARSLNLSQIDMQDDVIKLTMWHHMKIEAINSVKPSTSSGRTEKTHYFPVVPELVEGPRG